jgi:hypothetical protein
LLAGGDLAAFLGVAQNVGLGDEAMGTLAAWRMGGGASRGKGSWGFFDAMNVPELAERLFDEAENWLIENVPGLAAIRGPCSVEPLAPPGLLVDGFDVRPAAFVPYNPPYYQEMVEAQGYEPRQGWQVYTMSLTHVDLHPGATSSVCVLEREAWPGSGHALAGAYSRESAGLDPVAIEVPGLGPWLGHLAGDKRFAVHAEWRWTATQAFRKLIAVVSEDEGKTVAACMGIPDPGDALRVSRARLIPFGWALFALALRRTRRLRVFPAVAPPGWAAERLALLYGRLAAEAATRGYRQLDVAPIADEDTSNREALVSLGARSSQRFSIYEKVF